MAYRSLPVVNFQPDLRSAKGTNLRKGLAIRILRVLTLVSSDIIALSFAWILAINFGTFLESPWTKKPSFILLILIVGIAIIATKGLYSPGVYRRNYTALIKAVTLSEISLLLIAFLYEPDGYVSRSSFLIFWLLSITFTCVGRFIFDFSTKLLRKKGAIRYPIFVITDPQDQDNYLKYIKKENCYNLEGIADSTSLDRENRQATFEFLKKQGVVEAFVSWNAIRNRLYICWHFQNSGITLRILPSSNYIHHPKSTLWTIGSVPCLTIPAPIIAGSDFWIKRCFDLCCSIILLILFSALYLL
ncbi:MAG: sugar transferase, partial [Cyanobacteria bacterium J06649_11]